MSDPSRPPLIAPASDLHAQTANTDVEFHALMDIVFPQGWRDKDPKIIRDCAKRYNFGKLYGMRDRSFESLMTAREATLAHAPLCASTFEGKPCEAWAGHDGHHRQGHTWWDTAADDTHEWPSPFLQATPAPERADIPAPTAKTPVRTTEAPAAWHRIGVDIRRWDHGGLTTTLTGHAEMATIIVPIEVLKVFARGYLNYWSEHGDGPSDTVAETIGEASTARPDAAHQARAMASYILNAYLR